jgi:nicotinamidase-related amidase
MTQVGRQDAPWAALIGEGDRAAYAKAGFGGPSGLGSRPAMLIIDMQYRTTGTRRVPMLEAMDEFATSCGDRAWAAADKVVPLLALFRDKQWPVLYPHVAPKVSSETGRLAAKVPTMWDVPAKGYEFFESVAPRAGDILVPKKHPSAFFGTSLVSHLVDIGVDTLVMVGCTTSGCIRASVVDAFSYNYRVVVPEDCVYDRGDASHRINLFDMSQKYADVLPSSRLLTLLQDVPSRTAHA